MLYILLSVEAYMYWWVISKKFILEFDFWEVFGVLSKKGVNELDMPSKKCLSEDNWLLLRWKQLIGPLLMGRDEPQDIFICSSWNFMSELIAATLLWQLQIIAGQTWDNKLIMCYVHLETLLL